MVPTLMRNREWLTRCLASIERQSRPALLRVVGHDSPELVELCQRFGADLIADPGKGLSEAINAGFADLPPSVRHLGWLGDDDVLAPNALALGQDALDADRELTFVYGRIRYIDENSFSKCLIRPGRFAVAWSRWGRNYVGQPGSLFTRSSFEAVGGLDRTLRNSMDQDLFLRLSKVGRTMYLPVELAAWRVHPASISSLKGSQNESVDVGRRHQSGTNSLTRSVLRLSAKLVDRILLSVHPRVPGGPAPTVHGAPYYAVSSS